MPGDALRRRCYENSLWCDNKEKGGERRFTLLEEQESLSSRLSTVVKD